MSSGDGTVAIAVAVPLVVLLLLLCLALSWCLCFSDRAKGTQLVASLQRSHKGSEATLSKNASATRDMTSTASSEATKVTLPVAASPASAPRAPSESAACYGITTTEKVRL